VAQVTALAAATLTAISLLYRLRLVVALLALAIVLAAAVRPLVMALIRYRVPRGLALVIGYLCAAAAPVTVVALLLPSVGNELTAALDGFLPSYERHLGGWRGAGGRLALLAHWLPSATALATHVRSAALMGGAWHATLMVLQALASSVLVVVLSLSWSVHREPVMSGLAALIPAELRPLFRRLASDLGVGVGLHVFGETCKSLIALAVTALALAALHAPAPISTALLVAVLRVVPIAGLGLSMLVVAVAVAPLGVVMAAIVALCTGALLLALQRIVPRMLRSREYNPLLVAFVALLLASTIGWIGLVLAPAVAAAVQITIEAAFRARQDAAQAPVTVADIRARFDQLTAESLAKKSTSRRRLGLLSNLGGLLAAVESIERGDHHPHDHHRPRFEDRAA
jgi:predicted PurR-regulated permease PerM